MSTFTMKIVLTISTVSCKTRWSTSTMKWENRNTPCTSIFHHTLIQHFLGFIFFLFHLLNISVNFDFQRYSSPFINIFVFLYFSPYLRVYKMDARFATVCPMDVGHHGQPHDWCKHERVGLHGFYVQPWTSNCRQLLDQGFGVGLAFGCHVFWISVDWSWPLFQLVRF